MDFRLTDEQQVLRRSIRAFAEAEIRPHVMEWDEAQHFPVELVPRLADLGLLGIQFPERYGGAAMSAIDYCIAIEELSRVDPSIGITVAAHNGLCSSHIALFGTEAQKERFLSRLARGETLGAWGLTEPTAGSDAAGTRTVAVRDDDGWVIDGAKSFITHGGVGGIMVVMAVTDRARGNRGISAFIVERGTPGMSTGKKENKLGFRASDTCEVVFQKCHVPADQLLGEEGQGFIHTLQVLDAGRIGIAALSVGLAQGAYESALRYAQGAPPVRAADRVLPGHPVQAGRPGHEDRGSPVADLPRGLSEGSRTCARAASPRSPSCTPARWRCGPPRSACRSTAATASRRTTRPRSSSATSSS